MQDSGRNGTFGLLWTTYGSMTLGGLLAEHGEIPNHGNKWCLPALSADKGHNWKSDVSHGTIIPLNIPSKDLSSMDFLVFINYPDDTKND